MGINKNNKKKEEYIFDPYDFNSEVFKKYVKIYSENFFEPKLDLNNFWDDFALYFVYVSLIGSIFPETFLLSYFNRINEYDIYTKILFYLWLFVFICINIGDFCLIFDLRKKKRERNKKQKIDFEKEHDKWLNSVKRLYIKSIKTFNVEQYYKNIWIPVYIYFIKDKSTETIVYVGQTVDTKNRENKHHQKYPKNKFSFEIQEVVDIKDSDEREKYWIKYFGKENLDNISLGGSNILARTNFNVSKYQKLKNNGENY